MQTLPFSGAERAIRTEKKGMLGTVWCLSIILNLKRDAECPVKQTEFARGKHADKVRQHGLWEAHKLIAVDARVVFETLIWPNRHLGGQSFIRRVNRRADHR